MQLLLTLGTYHPTDANFQKKWHYWGAVMQVVDWPSGEVLRELRHEPPPEHLGGEGRLLFMGCHLTEDEIWVTTKTEVMAYGCRDFERRHLFSHPDSCDLHSVWRRGDEVWVANTGKEAVQLFSPEGERLREYPLGEASPAQRWDPDRDYRHQRDAKPYRVHVNQVFESDGAMWACSLNQRAAFAVEDPSRRMEIGVGQPHDGLWAEGCHWFTTTNGHLVAVNPRSLQVEEVHDLNGCYGDERPIGWCRGLDVVGRRAYVGFTRIRETRHGKHRFWRRSSEEGRPSRVAEVDLDSGEVIHEVPIEYGGSAVYSVRRFDS